MAVVYEEHVAVRATNSIPGCRVTGKVRHIVADGTSYLCGTKLAADYVSSLPPLSGQHLWYIGQLNDMPVCKRCDAKRRSLT